MRLSEKGQELPGLSPGLNVRHCRPGPQSIASPDLDPFYTKMCLVLCAEGAKKYLSTLGTIKTRLWIMQRRWVPNLL